MGEVNLGDLKEFEKRAKHKTRFRILLYTAIVLHLLN